MNLSINSVLTLSICLLLASCTSTRQAVKPTSLITIKNKSIRTITEKSYLAMLSRDSILLTARSRRYNFEYDFIRYYDDLGRLFKEQNIKNDDSFKNELLYKYSNLNDTVYTFRRDDMDSAFRLFETKYIDSNGIATINNFYDWKYYLEVSKKTKRKEVTNNYMLNKTGVNSHFQYDTDNKDQYELIHTFVDYYDKKNNSKRCLILNPDRTLWSSTRREFDNHNNETKREEFFPKKHNKFRANPENLNYTYTYIYNEKGDWIKKTEYLHGNLAFVVVRQIEYY